MDNDYSKDVESVTDDFLFDLAKFIDADERRPHIDNVEVINRIDRVYDIVQTLFNGYSKIEKRLHEPFPSMAYIKITGKRIKCINGLYLYKLRKLVDNIDIYTLTTGETVVSFAFHGVTRFVDD